MAKTTINPKNLYENRNTSDVFSRLVVMGILRILNQQLKYTQVWEDTSDGIQEVTVPFFFDFSGGSTTSEKFIQDNYMNWTDDECTEIGIKKMNGDYKPIPYGVITLESSQIESGNISNRFVMGQYKKKINGEIKSYVSCLYSIPLTYNFNVNIACDTVNTMWKIEQAYREYFYKNKTFHFNYKGTVCSARVGFPESITETKTNTYTMGAASPDGADVKLSFSLSCETYQPVFDPYTEMEADNNIKSFGTTITVQNTPVAKKEDGTISAVKNIPESITTEEDILLEWGYTYKRSDLMQVDILYQEKGSDALNVLAYNIDNHNCYHLQLENDFVKNNVEIDVIIQHQDNTVIVNAPQLKFYVDPSTNIVSSSTCTIIDKGFILSDEPQVDAVLTYQKSDGDIIEKDIKINLNNYSVDSENPVNMEDFVYNGDFEYRQIKLYVRDHNNPSIIDCFQDEDKDKDNWICVF